MLWFTMFPYSKIVSHNNIDKNLRVLYRLVCLCTDHNSGWVEFRELFYFDKHLPNFKLYTILKDYLLSSLKMLKFIVLTDKGGKTRKKITGSFNAKQLSM